MALTKSNLDISFSQGLDLKTDPWRLAPGKMLELVNSVFEKGGRLQKRNGFAALPSLIDAEAHTITTFKGALTAIGKYLYNYAPETRSWYNKGPIASVQTAVTPTVRTATSQSAQDVAITAEGLACSVWQDSDGTSKYQVTDNASSQVVVAATSLPTGAAQARVFQLGRFFIITFIDNPVLTYIALPILNPQNPSAPVSFGLSVSAADAGYDGVVANNNLYLAWSDSGPSVKISYLDSTLTHHVVKTTPTRQASYMTLTADTSTPTPTIWATFFDPNNSHIYTAAYDAQLNTALAITDLGATPDTLQMASTATGNELTLYYETENVYAGTATRSDYISKLSVTILGVASAPEVVIRGVGLGSKAFILGELSYFAVAYGGALQPTYFLITENGDIVAKLAYSNGGGYSASQVLPQVTVQGSTALMGYLFKDLLTSVNKAQGVTSVAGIYSQTGINLVSWTINNSPMSVAEIGSNLNLGSGYMWAYDGVKPVEQGFHLFPEDTTLHLTGAPGSMDPQQYYYQVVYEWSDGQGNLHRSAPSIPIGIILSIDDSVQLEIPTLRLTQKEAPNAVRIVIYRWSAAQQIYYQITSVSSPLQNDPSVDTVTYLDTQADSDIQGNQIIYTTGGVVENVASPACGPMTLFNSRLFVVNAENTDVIGYSKQIIQATPVEMSDLFTIFCAPTIGAQGSTGGIKALSSMDDKLIIFKQDAIYYVTGKGPDITGANNDFSDPIYVTSTAGCSNPQSVVLTPQGIMFQSDKGIWLLGRDLSTTYVGAAVEDFNTDVVKSAVNVPATNQVRFTLQGGTVLMYDYYYGQWGTFTNVPAVSSTIYQRLHTYINRYGQVFQESIGSYLDGSSPVLMSFKTGWMSLAGLQGLQRAYFFYLLGDYLSPHKMTLDIAYDYSKYPEQSTTISPDNYNPAYGDAPGPYGSESPYGGNLSVEQYRVFLNKQKCESFQIKMSESFDPSFGTTAGAGFTLSGINLVVGGKKSYNTLKASRSVG